MSSSARGGQASGSLRKAWDAAVDWIMRKEVVGIDKNGNKYYRSASMLTRCHAVMCSLAWLELLTISLQPSGTLRRLVGRRWSDARSNGVHYTSTMSLLMFPLSAWDRSGSFCWQDADFVLQPVGLVSLMINVLTG
jgi:hypothetical protein